MSQVDKIVDLKQSGYKFIGPFGMKGDRLNCGERSPIVMESPEGKKVIIKGDGSVEDLSENQQT